MASTSRLFVLFAALAAAGCSAHQGLDAELSYDAIVTSQRTLVPARYFGDDPNPAAVLPGTVRMPQPGGQSAACEWHLDNPCLLDPMGGGAVFGPNPGF